MCKFDKILYMKKEKLDIIYEDKYLIVVNKPSGLLTISTDKVKDDTLYHQVYTYLKQKYKGNKVFIVHRLDKDTSGLALFAKSELVKYKLQDNWDNAKRFYYAIVNGVVKKNKDTIKTYLKETKSLLVYSSNDKIHGKIAITNYEKINSNSKYTLLNIEIKTGRKNQIRVHLNDIGHSIVGDKKYGIKNNPLKRLCLHAYRLEFIHPVTGEKIILESKYPKIFNKLIEYKKDRN